MRTSYIIIISLLIAPISRCAERPEQERSKKYTYDLSLCAIFQQEAHYLKEWIEFHRLVGVQHFFLYNNLSTDNFAQVLAPYIKQGIVEVTDWPIEARPHNAAWVLSAYNNGLRKARGKTKWLAFLDVDEFLFPVQEKSLTTFLTRYEDYAAVCVNWVLFGTSHVSKIPSDKLLIECLTLRAPTNHQENLHVKSIIRPDFVKSMPSPHYALFKPGHFQVTANKQRFNGPFSPSIALDKIRINHYWSRDEDFFYNVKIERRMKDMGEPREACIQRNEALNKVYDKKIFKFIPKLKARLHMQQAD